MSNRNHKFWVTFILAAAMCMVVHTTWTQEADIMPSKPAELSLEDCIRLAIGNSYEIKLARLDFLIAETDLDAARAAFDTVFSADINYSIDKKKQLSVFGGAKSTESNYEVSAAKKLPTGTKITPSFKDTRTWTDSSYVSANPAHTAQAGVEIRQPIANNAFGYNDRRRITTAKIAIQNAGLDTKERIENLFAKIEKAYWQWVFSKESLKIHKEILNKARDLHKANERNYEMGRIEKADFLASQANVLIREKDALIAENQYRASEENIKLLMNVSPEFRVDPAGKLAYGRDEARLEECLRRAFSVRRDYKKARQELNKKEIILQTKANERWPEIDLVASMAANGIDTDLNEAVKDIKGSDAEYYAGIEVSIPVENNAAKGELKKARYDKEKAIVEIKNIERSIVTEVGNSFRDHATYETNVSRLIEAAGLQNEKLKEEEIRFKYGRSTTKTLIDYQQDYLNARLQVAQGILDLEVSRISLKKALNEIFGKYEGLL